MRSAAVVCGAAAGSSAATEGSAGGATAARSRPQWMHAVVGEGVGECVAERETLPERVALRVSLGV